MAYSGVYVFGDSLVDAGNALKLAKFYGDLTFSDLPEGAPAADQGYFQGRFTDGYTFADLLTNKAVGVVTKPIFPYGYEDPWIGIPIAPWASDPNGNNLNFAYGGAQIRQGGEAVPDFDGQTDAFRDAVDHDAPSSALYIVTIGGNDVRGLAKVGSNPAPLADGYDALDQAADKLAHELGQLIDEGARNFLITGIADVGLIPDYDIDHSNSLDATEQMRADAATLYSQYLDGLIRTQVVPALQAMGATITYVPMMDYQSGIATVTGGLNAILPTLEALYHLQPGTLTTDLLTYRDLVFFDDIHPTAQVHALFGSYAQALLTNTPWIETLPVAAADVDFAVQGSIAASGEVDKMVFALVAGTDYRFDMLGISSLGTVGSLADPAVSILSPAGSVAGSDADSGAGFDAVLIFNPVASGNYTLQLSATGSLTGAYALQATVIGGAAMQSGNVYTIDNAATLVLESAGGAGQDVVKASVSYALAAGSEIELLTTTNARGKTALNLTGNEFGQQIVGNNGDNVLDGKGGADTLTGGGGKDVFVLGGGAIDSITDYSKGEIVDVSQVLSVAAGVNAVSGGFLRVTTGGLVQIDANGGGDQWVTLSQINGNGAVSVRYLSGGSATTAILNRVADTTSVMLASAAAAAGLAAMPAAAQPTTADQSDTASLTFAAQVGGDFATSSLAAADLARPLLAGEAREAAGGAAISTSAHLAGDDSVAAIQTGIDLPEAHAGQMALLAAGTELPSVALPSLADGVPMASLALLHAAAAGADGPQPNGNVPQIIAEALAGGEAGSIDALLDALPGAGPSHAAVLATTGAETFASFAAFAPAVETIGVDMLTVHQDAVVTV